VDPPPISKVSPDADAEDAAKAKALPASCVCTISIFVERGMEKRRGSKGNHLHQTTYESLSTVKSRPEPRKTASQATFDLE